MERPFHARRPARLRLTEIREVGRTVTLARRLLLCAAGKAGKGCPEVPLRPLSTVIGLPLLLAALLLGSPARAISLFWEDFDGYSVFPVEIPAGDPVNPGLPEISEGADSSWFGARFAAPETGCADRTIACDLAVQKRGGSGNTTPTGRFGDSSGLLFSVDTSGQQDIVLRFDWRTFSAGFGDQLVAGIFVGDIPLDVFGADRTADLQAGPYAWSSWTELIRRDYGGWFSHHEFALPSDAGTVWVAFWIAADDGDYGKIDNVSVTASAIPPPPLPEPSLAVLAAAGLAAFALRRRRGYSRTS